ncbi:hypothetical protein V2S66_27340 [Streptomyces sp. V4-01]|uniref:Uncharacterized protein n=1 Tax=Actinacidiphila polyblastidii TaxID=3110430 RepID=A0ABU7PIM5_9ACTN|nr:hypothetical protein [Streptomyces sp. V4-01]
MNAHSTRVLLALRRFVAAPIPPSRLRVRGVLPAPESHVRVMLHGQGNITVDLPIWRPDRSDRYAPMWYVSALRELADAVQSGRMENPGTEPVKGDALIAQGVIGAEIATTEDEAVDFIVGDLAGDPLWHDAAGSIEPDVYTLAGFQQIDEKVVRVYVHHAGRVIGLDLAAQNRKATGPRSPGWWASTKIVAILRDEATLAAHRSTGTDDPFCDALFDLTRWA